VSRISFWWSVREKSIIYQMPTDASIRPNRASIVAAT
jgi:hypothetical protein